MDQILNSSLMYNSDILGNSSIGIINEHKIRLKYPKCNCKDFILFRNYLIMIFW